jgi:hypothetical protein
MIPANRPRMRNAMMPIGTSVYVGALVRAARFTRLSPPLLVTNAYRRFRGRSIPMGLPTPHESGLDRSRAVRGTRLAAIAP